VGLPYRQASLGEAPRRRGNGSEICVDREVDPRAFEDTVAEARDVLAFALLGLAAVLGSMGRGRSKPRDLPPIVPLAMRLAPRAVLDPHDVVRSGPVCFQKK